MKGVCLNPGHAGTVGAVGIDKKITEEYFANRQVIMLKTILDGNGIKNEIIKQNKNELFALGKKASGFDMFLSFHFNAAFKKEMYTCFLVSQYSNKLSTQFGMKLMQNLKQATGCKLYDGHGIMIINHVAVLNAASKTDCPIVGLIESEFIDDETDINDFSWRVIKKTEIIAATIISHFRGDNAKNN